MDAAKASSPLTPYGLADTLLWIYDDSRRIIAKYVTVTSLAAIVCSSLSEIRQDWQVRRTLYAMSAWPRWAGTSDFLATLHVIYSLTGYGVDTLNMYSSGIYAHSVAPRYLRSRAILTIPSWHSSDPLRRVSPHCVGFASPSVLHLGWKLHPYHVLKLCFL